MRDLFLVCEGKHDQIDQCVLQLLVLDAHGVPARIKPAGGSSSLGALATFLRQDASRGPSMSSVVEPVIFTVSDRDFQSLSRAEVTWADPMCRELIWRRHEIENYLIEPSVVHTWFESLRQRPPQKIAIQHLPTTLGQVESFVESLARPLLEHHVGQLVFNEMQSTYRKYTDTTRLSRPQKSGKISLDPNRLPAPARTDWLNALNVEWKRVERNRRKMGRIPRWTANQIRHRFDTLFAELSLPSCFLAKTYLLDFEGKGLLWALGDRLKMLANLSISKEKLVQELIGALPAACLNFKPFKPDEFQDLASRMKMSAV